MRDVSPVSNSTAWAEHPQAPARGSAPRDVEEAGSAGRAPGSSGPPLCSFCKARLPSPRSDGGRSAPREVSWPETAWPSGPSCCPREKAAAGTRRTAVSAPGSGGRRRRVHLPKNATSQCHAPPLRARLRLTATPARGGILLVFKRLGSPFIPLHRPISPRDRRSRWPGEPAGHLDRCR